jgi:murein L,D-transpeptidase YcbB/YkuD
MERWRWMPRELGDFHVIANVPEYRLWVMREGESIFTTRTVVGQNRHRTAIFSDEMEYMAVNPYWNVPSSIARNEILPRLLQDPGYAHRGNYEILYNGQPLIRLRSTGRPPPNRACRASASARAHAMR